VKATAPDLSALDGATYWDVHQALVASGKLTIVDLLDSLPWFRKAADWTAWRAFLCAAYGLPMTDEEFAIYQECTGREDRPTKRAREVYVPTGRRGRKSAIAALMAVEAAAFRDHSAAGYLAPGERALVPVMAKDKADAQTIRRYCGAILTDPLLDGSPNPLAELILERDPDTGQEGRSTERIALRTRCDIEVRALKVTSGRGRTIPLFLGDEAAFWPTDDAAEPDVEILRAIEPAQVMVPGAMIALLSSPYARKGMLWEKYKAHYGKPGDVLVWQAPTVRMHDTPQIRAHVKKAYDADPISAAAEYGAKFRTDVESYLPIELVEAATDHGIRVRPKATQTYHAFCDPSGGSQDSMTLAIAHWDHALQASVLDYLGEWAPKPDEEREATTFSPEEATSEAAEVLKSYGLSVVTGDRYAGEWVRERFRAHGIRYHVSDVTKSNLYIDLVPLFTGGTVRILDHDKLRRQLVGLERRTARGGRDSVDHSPGQHDDCANSAAGALVAADQYGRRLRKLEEPVAPATTTNELLRRRIQASVEQQLGVDKEGKPRKSAGKVYTPPWGRR
jgi:hypothetical protein